MRVIHFLNVRNADCNIIEHNSGRISVIDVCCTRKEIINEECSQEDSRIIMNSNVAGNYRQKEHPENPVRYLNKVIKFKYFQIYSNSS